MSVSDDLNPIKTDVALIKNDLKNIERFFDKVDEAMDQMVSISQDIAVQQSVLESFERKLTTLEEKLDTQSRVAIESRFAFKEELDDHKYRFKQAMTDGMGDAQTAHQEHNEKLRVWMDDSRERTLRAITTLSKEFDLKLEDQEKRLRGLENLKYYMLGAVALATAAGNYIIDMMTGK